MEKLYTGHKQQYRRTVLPQGFTESPNLFGQVLEQVLEKYNLPPDVSVLQYVNDLLISGKKREGVAEATNVLLNFPGE